MVSNCNSYRRKTVSRTVWGLALSWSNNSEVQFMSRSGFNVSYASSKTACSVLQAKTTQIVTFLLVRFALGHCCSVGSGGSNFSLTVVVKNSLFITCHNSIQHSFISVSTAFRPNSNGVFFCSVLSKCNIDISSYFCRVSSALELVFKNHSNFLKINPSGLNWLRKQLGVDNWRLHIFLKKSLMRTMWRKFHSKISYYEGSRSIRITHYSKMTMSFFNPYYNGYVNIFFALLNCNIHFYNFIFFF